MVKFIKLTQINDPGQQNTTLVINIDYITRSEFDFEAGCYRLWVLKYGPNGTTITGFEVKETPDEILALIKEAE